MHVVLQHMHGFVYIWKRLSNQRYLHIGHALVFVKWKPKKTKGQKKGKESHTSKPAKWLALSLNYLISRGSLVNMILYKSLWDKTHYPLLASSLTQKMAGPSSHPKTTSHSLYIFSLNSPSYSSSSSSSSTSPTLSSMKLKGTLAHTRIARALSRAKSIIIHILKDLQLIEFVVSLKKNKRRNKLYFGSFRLHYNWCSSHVLPVPSPITDYYDSTWNSVVHAEYDDIAESQLSGYLQWLEEKKARGNSGASDHMDDIDRLADMFIANSHEKFRLEKQESYRRFQEMMARSV